ncbi:uncharacterized protein [Ptychodera flava]|uniref:uncharacterized protein isoform X2 n=1 Tax=Ptychodera flava TaxID=63121 RepID=UPI003969E6F9
METVNRALFIVTGVCLLTQALCSEESLLDKDVCQTPLNGPIEQLLCYLGNGDVHVPSSRVLTSSTIPMSIQRVRIRNYLTNRYQYDLGNRLQLTLANMRFMNRRRAYLAETLLFLHILEDEMTKAISEMENDDKIYTFQHQIECNCPFFYIDDDGSTKGFYLDILQEICREAGKTCMLQYLPFTHCLTEGENGNLAGGKGLLGRTIDACFVAMNKEIANIFWTSHSFWKYSGTSQFIVKEGNPENFNSRNITGKKVVFLEGWHSNNRCLRDNKVVGADTLQYERIVVPYSYLPYYLENNEVDAVFALTLPVGEGSDQRFELLTGTPVGFEPLDDVMHCAEGVGAVARKDSSLIKWFNEALMKLKKSGKYAALCEDAKKKHGKMGRIDCEDSF